MKKVTTKSGIAIALVLLMGLVALLGGCTPADKEVEATKAPVKDEATKAPEKEEATAVAEELIPITVGVAPYPMYQQFQMAVDRGMDEVFGLDITIKQMSSTSVGYENLLRGDIDVSSGAIADHVVVMETTPEIISYMPVGIFQGFFYVARAEDTMSWDDAVEQLGAEGAKMQQIEQMKGRTFCIIPQRKAFVMSTITQAGLTEDDVEFLYFADDQKAGTAFLSGQGDYYMGSLPQQTAIIKQGDGTEYINAGGWEIMGAAGLWYDTMLTTEKFFTEKKDAAERLYALMCALVNVFDKDMIAFSTDAVEVFKSVGATFTVAEYIEFQTEFDDFMSLEEANDSFFNPEHDMYWKNAVDFQIEQALVDGALKTSKDAADFYQQGEDLFKSVMANQELVDLINSYK